MRSEEGLQAASMCRLDADSAVSVLRKAGQEDALSPARYMLGRGVKRKLSEYEDPVMGLPYPQQRQLVLDLCLDKLQSCQRRSEPSLHRSVLLANTLRQIQQEMRLEWGTCLPPTMPTPSLLHPPTPRHIPELPPVSVESSPLLSGHLSFSSSSSSSSSSPSEDAAAQRDCVQSKLSSLSDEADTRTSDSLFGSFEITNSTSYLTDLPLDDIFDDIDTSMYDSSEISVLAFSASAVGEDGLKSFGCSSNSTLQLCLSDLSDLDHIMEVLVRS